MKFKQWQERKYEGERDPTLLPTWQEAITQVVKSEILYPRMPAILRRQQKKAGQKRKDQHSFKKVEPEDNLAKVEQMAQDMRQSKRQELREAIRTKSRAVKISSRAQNITPREI